MKIPLQRGQEVELEVQRTAFEGTSVARYGEVVVFVDGGVPGDTVRARVSAVKRRHAEARVVEVLTASPDRVVPRCSHFGVCGGCKWQHVDYPAQLRFKEEQVRDLFQRIGGFESARPLPIIGADDIYFYRNKMEYSFSRQEWLPDPPQDDAAPQSGVYLGLHVPQRYAKVLDIQECHLQSDASNRILAFTRSFARNSGLEVYESDANEGYFRFLVIRQSMRTGELMVNLVTFEDRPDLMEQFAAGLKGEVPEITTVVNTVNTRKAQVATGDTERVYLGDGVIHERLGAHTYTISPGSFFQTNTAQAERLYSVAKELARLEKDQCVYDLYCGTGTIAMFIADSVAQVVGIESVESAVTDAAQNARVNGITNCEFLLGDLKDRLKTREEWMGRFPDPDVLIIDPPRSGMHPGAVEEILKMNVPRIVYISCNPSTQARDAKLLCADRYQLSVLQPVDMFPHTYHIENVALFELRSSAS